MTSTTTMMIAAQEKLLADQTEELEWLQAKERPTFDHDKRVNKVLNEITRLTKSLDRLRREQANQNNPAESFDAEAWCQTLIQENDIVFTAKPAIYWLKNKRDTQGLPINLPPLSLINRHWNLSEKKCRSVFEDILDGTGRKYDKATYSFIEQPPNILNLMTTENWVQPVEGEPHEIFDLLLLSIGGGTQEGFEHLRACLLWKRAHPEDVMLPSPVLYGTGGAGKDFFFGKVLKTMFGGQSASLGTSAVTGSFNGLLAGKTVVLINEAAEKKLDYEKLKETVGSPELSINEKYGAQYVADNTPWYWLGCNDRTGAVKMAGDGVDRRWSPIKITKSLWHWVMEAKGMTKVEAEAWIAEANPVTTDRVEVGKWLNSLIERGMPTVRPTPLRTRDYEELAEQAEGPLEKLAAILDDSDVDYLLGDVAYRGYTQLFKQDNPSGRPLGLGKFYTMLAAHMEEAYPGRWVVAREDVRTGQATKTAPQKVIRRTSFRGVMEKAAMTRLVDYMDRVTMFLPSWIEPERPVTF